ncbi:MAG: ATP-binding protein, partial [Pseudomonadota bacterium]
LSNASKFTQNGEITLSVHRTETETGGRINISVTDTGVGISKEAQDNLFSNFTQANASINAKFGGTGLGLSLSRNLIRLMDGDITVNSVEGEGTTFTIDLPTYVTSHDTEEPDVETEEHTDENLDEAIGDLKKLSASYAGLSAVNPKQGIKGKILIVDDDQSFLELTERMLNKEGYSAICTDTPYSVLQVARTVRPAAVFVDVLMPDIDGWEVISTLKSDPVTADIPVFMLSILEEREKARDHSAADFVTKPLDALKLKKIIQKIENLDSGSGNNVMAG